MREGKRAQTRADFAAKLSIALKEAEESLFWLELLKEGGFITDYEFDSMYADCEELVKMLVSATKKLYDKESK